MRSHFPSLQDKVLDKAQHHFETIAPYEKSNVWSFERLLQSTRSLKVGFCFETNTSRYLRCSQNHHCNQSTKYNSRQPVLNHEVCFLYHCFVDRQLASMPTPMSISVPPIVSSVVVAVVEAEAEADDLFGSISFLELPTCRRYRLRCFARLSTETLGKAEATPGVFTAKLSDLTAVGFFYSARSISHR